MFIEKRNIGSQAAKPTKGAIVLGVGVLVGVFVGVFVGDGVTVLVGVGVGVFVGVGVGVGHIPLLQNPPRVAVPIISPDDITLLDEQMLVFVNGEMNWDTPLQSI